MRERDMRTAIQLFIVAGKQIFKPEDVQLAELCPR